MYLNKSPEEKKIDSIKKLVDQIDFPIVVEGIRDKRALSFFGFEKIYTISGKTLEDIATIVVSSKPESVAILTDFDEEGKRCFNRLVKLFQASGVNVDNSLRRKIKYITSIQKIEELNFLIKNYESKLNLLSCKTV